MKTQTNDRPKTAKLKDILIGVDDLRWGGEFFTARRGFFYTNGKTHMDFANEIKTQLEKRGYSVEVLFCQTHHAAFKGDAPLRKSSHWWCTFKCEKAPIPQPEDPWEGLTE